MSLLKRIQHDAVPIIEDILAVSGAPGTSIAVIHDGNTLFTHHFGYRDVAKQLRPDNATRYNINSLTKAMTTALVGIEVSRGTLDLLAPVSSYLPELRSASKDVETQSTALDMLSHRMGLTGFDDLWVGAGNVILIPKKDALRTFASLEQAVPFRSSFSYNNWGYEIMSQVLEQLTNRKYAEMVHDELFVPLSMSRTSTSWDESDDNEASSYVVLHDLSPFPIPKPALAADTIMEAAGGVKSTLDDMIKLEKAYLSSIKSQFSTDKRDPEGTLKEVRMIASNHARLPGTSLHEQGYGLGWARGQLPGPLGRISYNAALGDEPIIGAGTNGPLIIYHHGSMPGSTSAVDLIPDTNSAIIVLQNSMQAFDSADFIGQALIEHMLDLPQKTDWAAVSREFSRKGHNHLSEIASELKDKQIPGTHPRGLQLYTGRYHNDVNTFFIDVLLEDGVLSMQHQGLKSQRYELKHYHKDTFSWVMTYDDVVKRGRSSFAYNAQYYLIEFEGDTGSFTEKLLWEADDNFPGKKQVFSKHIVKPQSYVSLDGQAVMVVPILTIVALILVWQRRTLKHITTSPTLSITTLSPLHQSPTSHTVRSHRGVHETFARYGCGYARDQSREPERVSGASNLPAATSSRGPAWAVVFLVVIMSVFTLLCCL